MPPVALVSHLETHRDAAPRPLALVRGDANAPSPVRVVLAAGKPIVRAGLRVFLELDDRITVFGEAATAEEALALASRMDHGVVLIDAGLPGLDTVKLTARLRAKSELGVLIVAASDAAPPDLVRAVLSSCHRHRRPRVTEIGPVDARANLRLVTDKGH
jgi:CheY-like chemotaxis protein